MYIHYMCVCILCISNHVSVVIKHSHSIHVLSVWLTVVIAVKHENCTESIIICYYIRLYA